MANLGGITGHDVKDGIRQAAEDFGAISEDLVTISGDTDVTMLQGDDRKNFLQGLTQQEFDILERVARHSGEKGLMRLGRIMQERDAT